MGTKPVNATVRLGGWEGAGSRVNHEPEDLPGKLTDVPSWAGELARMSCGSNPQGLSGLGDFLFAHLCMAWSMVDWTVDEYGDTRPGDGRLRECR